MIPEDGNIVRSIEKSISDIDLGYVDLFLIHSGRVGSHCRATLWKALEEVKAKGLIRSIGVSNL